jgi:hypothetical protein
MELSKSCAPVNVRNCSTVKQIALDDFVTMALIRNDGCGVPADPTRQSLPIAEWHWPTAGRCFPRENPQSVTRPKMRQSMSDIFP